MSLKLNFLCVFLILFIQGVHPEPGNPDESDKISSDVNNLMTELVKEIQSGTAATPDQVNKFLIQTIRVAIAWMSRISKNVDSQFAAMRCYRDSVIKFTEKIEKSILGFIDCKVKTVTASEIELKSWLASAKIYFTSISTQIKESLGQLENCTKDTYFYGCTINQLANMITKVKAKIRTLPTTLLRPGWKVVLEIVTNSRKCSANEWKELSKFYNEFKVEAAVCYKKLLVAILGGGPKEFTQHQTGTWWIG